MTKSIVALLLCVGFSAFGQNVNFEWAKQFGGIDSEDAEDLVQDELGNTYITGYFFGTADFDPSSNSFNVTAAGAQDVFILKLDPSGNLVWVKTVGGIEGDNGNAIAVDANGNVYVTGLFRGTADFDPGSNVLNRTSSGQFDSFILKLDSNGNFSWVKTFGSSLGDVGYSIAIHNTHLYSAGTFRGAVDFDPGVGTQILSPSGQTDAYVNKFDLDGNFIWAKASGGSDFEDCYSLTIDNNGDILTTGYFSGTADFDPGTSSFTLTSSGFYDAFIQKLDPNGNFIWAKAIGGATDEETGRSIISDNTGSIYVVGTFFGTTNFDPSGSNYNLTSAGGYDNFVVKLDGSGNFLWAKSFGGSFNDVVNDVYLDNNGGVYLTGTFRETVDFDPGIGEYNLISPTFNDAFISKLSSEGSFLWARSFGGSTNSELGDALIVDNLGSIFTIGTFGSSTDFDPGSEIFTIDPFGAIDVFLHKLSQCTPNSGEETVNACGSYYWSATGTTYTSNGVYTATLQNISGCDSLATLNLSVTNFNTQVTEVSDLVLTSNQSGTQYQWVDCNNSFSEILNATSQSFTVTENGSYAVVVTDGTCSDTSDCLVIDYVSFDEATIDSFTIYPNPSQGKLIVNSIIIEPIDFRIIDLTGREVLNGQIEANKQEIDLDRFESGTYYIQSEGKVLKFELIH
jgi:hypothetical protein